MSFDLFKKFRKCYFCKENKNLNRVEVFHYDSVEYYYYHEECYQRIIRNPEQHRQFINVAIIITDCLEKARLRELELAQDLKNKVLRLRSLSKLPEKPDVDAQESCPSGEDVNLKTRFEILRN